MQRIARLGMVCCMLGLAAAGCKDNKGEMAMSPAPSASYESPSNDYYGPGSLNPPNSSAQGSSEYEVYTPDDSNTYAQSNTYGQTQNGGYVGAGQSQTTYDSYATQASATPQRGGRHVVAKGDTLYSLARAYYNGDMSKWRDIYAANRGTLRDPNSLRVGQQLIIP